MVESNFKGINYRKLFENTILIKCILTLNDLNAIEIVIRTFDLSNSSAIKIISPSRTIIALYTIMIT